MTMQFKRKNLPPPKRKQIKHSINHVIKRNFKQTANIILKADNKRNHKHINYRCDNSHYNVRLQRRQYKYERKTRQPHSNIKTNSRQYLKEIRKRAQLQKSIRKLGMLIRHKIRKNHMREHYLKMHNTTNKQNN